MAYLLVSLLFFVTDSAAKKRVRVKRRTVLREADRGKAISLAQVFLCFVFFFLLANTLASGQRALKIWQSLYPLGAPFTRRTCIPLRMHFIRPSQRTRADLAGCCSVGQEKVWAAQYDCKRMRSSCRPCVYR